VKPAPSGPFSRDQQVPLRWLASSNGPPAALVRTGQTSRGRLPGTATAKPKVLARASEPTWVTGAELTKL